MKQAEEKTPKYAIDEVWELHTALTEALLQTLYILEDMRGMKRPAAPRLARTTGNENGSKLIVT